LEKVGGIVEEFFAVGSLFAPWLIQVANPRAK
jgi:hypothetical protein